MAILSDPQPINGSNTCPNCKAQIIGNEVHYCDAKRVEETIRFNINAGLIHDDRIADLVKDLNRLIAEAKIEELEHIRLGADKFQKTMINDRLNTLRKELENE